MAQLVYAGSTPDGKVQLYVRALDRYESQVIPGTENAAQPFLSPDGRWVAFFSDGKLKKVSLDGGAPVVLADVRTPRGEAWDGSDGILVTPLNNAGVSRIPAAGGQIEPFTKVAPGEMSHRWPILLPDRSAVLFAIWNDTGWEPSRIAAQKSGSMDHAVVVEGGGYPRYVRDVSTERGYLVYARSEGLLAAPFDEASLKLTGQPVPVVDDVVTNLSGGAHFDISANGTLAYVPGTVGESNRDLMWVTLDGKATLARRGNMGRFFALSPDGTRVARNNITGQREVWIDDLVRGTSTRLTNAPNNFSSVWSRDGLWLAFARGAPKVDIYRRRVDQTGPEEQLTSLPQGTAPTGFSPDGNLLAFYENNPVSSYDIWVMTLPAAAPSGATTVISTPAVRPFVKTNFTENGAVFSPDGRWLAYQSNESGRFEIYVRSFPDGERTVQVSNEGGIGPIWSANGRDLFFRGTDGMMMAAAVKLAPDIELSKPRVLFDARRYENSFGVSPDGQRLLMMPLIPTEGSAAQIHVILNFISELRARVR